MANENRISIEITADGSAAVAALNKVTGGMQKLESDTRGIVGQIRSHWLGVSAAIAGVSVTIVKTWRMAEEAAGYQEQMDSLNALASRYGTTADAIVDSLQRATTGLLSQKEAADLAAGALIKGIDPDSLTRFGTIAEDLSDVTQGSITDIIDAIETAISTGRAQAIRQMGITADLGEAEEEYADKIGKTRDQLSSYEIIQARVNEILEEGEIATKDLGGGYDSMGDKMERLKKRIENVKLSIGNLMMRLAAELFLIVDGIKLMFAETDLCWAKLELRMEKGLQGLINKLKPGKDIKIFDLSIAEKNIKALEEKTQTTKSSVKDLLDILLDYGGAKANPSPIISKLDIDRIDTTKKKVKELTEAEGKTAKVKELTEKVKELTEAERERASVEKQIKADIELLKKEEVSPIEAINKQAEAWKKMGADVKLVNEWIALSTKKENKKMAEEVSAIMSDLTDREVRLKKEGLEKELYDIDVKHKGEIDRLTKAEATKEEIKRAQDIQKLEREAEITEYQKQQEEERTRKQQEESEKRKRLDEAEKINKKKLEEEKKEAERERYEEAWRMTNETFAMVEGDLGRQFSLFSTHIKVMADLNRKGELQKIDIAQHSAGALSAITMGLIVSSKKANLDTFRVYKAFAKAEAIISAYAGAARAFKDLPFPFSYIVAAANLAAGLARAEQISAVRPESEPSPSGGGGGAPPLPPPPPIATIEEKEAKKEQIVNVYIYGNVVDQDKFARELVPSLQKAISDGVK